MVEFIEIIIIPVVIFIIGYFIVKWLITTKGWENSVKISLILNSIWLAYSVPLIFINQFFIGGFLLFKILIIVMNILVGLFILWGFYNHALLESFIVIILIQGVLLIISLMLSAIQEILLIFSIVGNERLDVSKGVFIILILAILGISILMAYWGDKVQLVKYRRTFALISITPGIYFLMIAFIIQQEEFYDGMNLFFLPNIVFNILISLTIAIISIFTFKRISYKTIEFKKIRGLDVLEKGKTLLEVKDLKVYYPLLKGILKRQVGAVKAVNGVSFSVNTGETLGIVGESGCGKTTIAKAILGLVEKTDGAVLFWGKSVPPEYSSALRQKIQMVFQDPDASLNPRLKVVDIISEPLKNLLGVTNKLEIRKLVLKLLEQVSLKREHLDRFPHEFSGGQKQRIVIARALASNPELIILDEPTSALDVSVQAQILNLLKDLQAKYGYGFLFITHNLAVVNHIADRVAVMYLGKVVEVGSIDQIFTNPTHPYTQALLASRSEIDPYDQEIKFVISGEVPSPIAPPPGCAFNPRCSSDARTKECEMELPHKIKIEEGHYIWCINPPTSMQAKIQESEEIKY